jgi:hypothetical protein
MGIMQRLFLPDLRGAANQAQTYLRRRENE